MAANDQYRERLAQTVVDFLNNAVNGPGPRSTGHRALAELERDVGGIMQELWDSIPAALNDALLGKPDDQKGRTMPKTERGDLYRTVSEFVYRNAVKLGLCVEKVEILMHPATFNALLIDYPSFTLQPEITIGGFLIRQDASVWPGDVLFRYEDRLTLPH